MKIWFFWNCCLKRSKFWLWSKKYFSKMWKLKKDATYRQGRSWIFFVRTYQHQTLPVPTSPTLHLPTVGSTLTHNVPFLKAKLWTYVYSVSKKGKYRKYLRTYIYIILQEVSKWVQSNVPTPTPFKNQNKHLFCHFFFNFR